MLRLKPDLGALDPYHLGACHLTLLPGHSRPPQALWVGAGAGLEHPWAWGKDSEANKRG